MAQGHLQYESGVINGALDMLLQRRTPMTLTAGNLSMEEGQTETSSKHFSVSNMSGAPGVTWSLRSMKNHTKSGWLKVKEVGDSTVVPRQQRSMLVVRG